MSSRALGALLASSLVCIGFSGGVFFGVYNERKQIADYWWTNCTGLWPAGSESKTFCASLFEKELGFSDPRGRR